ncbi:MAG TPA: hypothetical protein VGT41_05820 [Candidatus Babeliales bacterium]|nr:hypothetical protein [Candidatus Babeliales bacterium]
MNKKLLFLDNGVKSAYCYAQVDPNNLEIERKSLDEGQNNVSTISELISEILPNFEDDYDGIENIISLIEYCGKGKLAKETCEKKPEEFKSCFPPVGHIDGLIDNLGETDECVQSLDLEFNQILEKLKNFFETQIDPIQIVDSVEGKLKKYQFHVSVLGIDTAFRGMLGSLKADGKNSVYFYELCVIFSWNELFRHDKWTENKATQDIIMDLLAGYYLGSRQIFDVPGSVLFGRMAANRDVFKKKHRELADINAIEWLLMGHSLPDHAARVPVIVITTDTELKDALRECIKGAVRLRNSLKKYPALSDRHFEFVPGILIEVGTTDIYRKPTIVDVAQEIG